MFHKLSIIFNVDPDYIRSFIWFSMFLAMYFINRKYKKMDKEIEIYTKRMDIFRKSWFNYPDLLNQFHDYNRVARESKGRSDAYYDTIEILNNYDNLSSGQLRMVIQSLRDKQNSSERLLKENQRSMEYTLARYDELSGD